MCQWSEGLIVQKSDSLTANPNSIPVANCNPNPNPK